jgi:hypothetical protein
MRGPVNRFWSAIVGLLTLLLLSLSPLGCGSSEPVPLVPETPPTEKATMPATATAVASQTVVAGCQMCMFGAADAKGCFWAVELDGKNYLVEGDELPKDHKSHGPEGMCTVKREVTVEGWIDGDAFVATQFDLLPFEPGKHAQPDGPAH